MRERVGVGALTEWPGVACLVGTLCMCFFQAACGGGSTGDPPWLPTPGGGTTGGDTWGTETTTGSPVVGDAALGPGVLQDAAASPDASLPSPDAGGDPEAAVPVDDAGADLVDAAADAGSVDASVTPAEPAEAPLPGTSASVFPAPGALTTCPDPVLRLRFSEAPSLGRSGRVELFDVEHPDRAVASLDMAAQRVTVHAGGRAFAYERPAYVDADQALFYLPDVALERGHTYAVKIGSGVFSQPALTVNDLDTWRFTVAATGPAAGAMRVAHDGTGDFCTLARAFDAVPANNTTPVEISVAPGKHYGIVVLENKGAVTLTGAGRSETVIVGVNNENLNGGTAARALFAIDRAADITIEHLTIHNQTPQGGSQAEALKMQRCERCRVRDIAALSLQDTLLMSGSIYVENSYIEGNVDYVWGTGAVFFKDCELKTVGRGGYLVQSRNGAGEHGYVFVDCTLSSDPGVGDTVLARIEVDRFPASEVAFIDCAMGPHITQEGWVVTGFGSTAQLRFGEYGSQDLNGAPLSTSGRHRASRQLSASEATALRDPAAVLGFTP